MSDLISDPRPAPMLCKTCGHDGVFHALDINMEFCEAPDCECEKFAPSSSAEPAPPIFADGHLPDPDAENDPSLIDLDTDCAFCGKQHQHPGADRECPCSRHIDGGYGPVNGPCNAAPHESLREKSSLSPVQEEATPTLDTARVTQIVAFLGDQRRTQSNMKFQLSNGDAEQLRLLASALPALLEASRRADMLAASVDHQDRLVSILKDELETVSRELSGSISERETLTAELEKIVAICEQYGCCASFYAGHDYAFDAVRRFRQWADGRNTDAKESRAAVAHLTTEHRQLRADLRHAVEGRDMFEFFSAEATKEIRELERRSEQAIQDIEALPPLKPIAHPNGEASMVQAVFGQFVKRETVLRILRGSP